MTRPDGKFIIYQMLLRVFGNTSECVPGGSLSINGTGRFCDIDTSVLNNIRKLSVSYIWLTGVIRHSTYPEPGVKGLAGSPYAISDYGDVNPYLARNAGKRMSEFQSLVKRIHKAGMGVILDFVPNHVSCNYSPDSSIKFTDENFYPGRYHDGDWTDTVKINYTNRATWDKMKDILLLWAERGADGFRCDMAELVPVDFWRWCIPQVKEAYPDIIFIAEVYQPDRYREFLWAGFDYLYDKSCFYDTLLGVLREGWSASALTSAWQRLGDIQPKMLNFMENHDEPRITSPRICGDAGKGIAATAASILFNNAPFMLYFGQELGEDGMEQAGYSGPDGRTTIYDWWSIPCVSGMIRGAREGDEKKYLDSYRAGILDSYRDLLALAVSNDAFRNGACYDLQYVNPHSSSYNPDLQFSFLRFDGEKLYLCAVSFASQEVDITVNIPEDAYRYFGLEVGARQIDIKVNRYEYRDITQHIH